MTSLCNAVTLYFKESASGTCRVSSSLWTYSTDALVLVMVDLVFEARALFGGLDVPDRPDDLPSVLGDLGTEHQTQTRHKIFQFFNPPL